MRDCPRWRRFSSALAWLLKSRVCPIAQKRRGENSISTCTRTSKSKQYIWVCHAQTKKRISIAHKVCTRMLQQRYIAHSERTRTQRKNIKHGIISLKHTHTHARTHAPFTSAHARTPIHRGTQHEYAANWLTAFLAFTTVPSSGSVISSWSFSSAVEARKTNKGLSINALYTSLYKCRKCLLSVSGRICGGICALAPSWACVR